MRALTLWDDPDLAAEYAYTIHQNGHRPVLYKVAADGFALVPDDTGIEPVIGAWHADRVPAECLRRIPIPWPSWALDEQGRGPDDEDYQDS